MDVPEGTAAEVLLWVDDDPARAQAALEAERAGPNRSTLITRLESIASKEASVSENTTTEPEAPEGNAPAPEPPSGEDLSVDLADRATVVGPANVVTPDIDKPDDSYDLVKAEPREPDEEAPIDAEPVEFLQLASNNGVVVIRFNDNAVLLDTQMALALSRDLRSALANVTY
jgi:hypothetical protein